MKELTYQEAAVELQRLYETLGLSCEIKHLGVFSDPKSELMTRPWVHNAYEYTFTTNKPGTVVQKETFTWRAGMGIKVKSTPAEVLGTICRDAVSAEGQSFEQWASDFGYDTNSRKAEAVFKECQMHNVRLWRLKVPRDRITQLAELASQL